MRKTYRAVLILLLLSACTSFALPATLNLPAPDAFSDSPPWVYTDLRLLDAHPATQPDGDITAVYLRLSGKGQWQIRIEMLDSSVPGGSDVYIAIDHSPGGTRKLPIQNTASLDWDTLLVLPAAGSLQVLDADGKSRPGSALQVLRRPDLDTLEINLKSRLLGGANPRLQVQVFTTLSGQVQAADGTGVVRYNASPPQRARVLLAFWNTLPAYTPAQTLRRWDGAHTGPHGTRHGLFNLLRTARARRIPLLLLDLKTPPSLAALEFAGGQALVEQMHAAGLLSLPDVQLLPFELPASQAGRLADEAAQLSRTVAQSFGMPASALLYTGETAALPASRLRSYRAVFRRSQGDLPACPFSQPPLLMAERQGGQRVYHLNVCTDPEQVSSDGLSLATRQALLETALQTGAGGDARLMLLGGDLARSPWGEPASARAALRYLASRPWILALNERQLLDLPTPGGAKSQPTGSRPAQPARAVPASDPAPVPIPDGLALQATALQGLSPAVIESLAALYGPVSPQPVGLSELRLAYLGQSGALALASDWASQPPALASARAFSTCHLDVDGDGLPECILASASVLSIFETGQGALTHLFVRQQFVAHQIIAPASQFAVGLSLPEGWNPANGRRADPAVLIGAFAFQNGPVKADLQSDLLIFSGSDGVCVYRLLPDGLQVEVNPAHAITTQIAVALEPQRRFSAGWSMAYQGGELPGGWVWRLAGGPALVVRSTAGMQAAAFTDTLEWMGQPEDPNRETPPGHFLPFPMARLEVTANGPFTVSLRLESH